MPHVFLWHNVPHYVPLLTFPISQGQCNPNPCLNNGECEQRGRKQFKCDCPRPYRGKRCERGLEKKSHFPMKTGHIYTIYNQYKLIHAIVLSQVQMFVGKVGVAAVNVCWLQCLRSMSANARSPSSLHAAHIVSTISLSKQNRIPLLHKFLRFLTASFLC